MLYPAKPGTTYSPADDYRAPGTPEIIATGFKEPKLTLEG